MYPRTTNILFTSVKAKKSDPVSNVYLPLDCINAMLIPELLVHVSTFHKVQPCNRADTTIPPIFVYKTSLLLNSFVIIDGRVDMTS